MFLQNVSDHIEDHTYNDSEDHSLQFCAVNKDSVCNLYLFYESVIVL
jgi:hypothetical protein